MRLIAPLAIVVFSLGCGGPPIPKQTLFAKNTSVIELNVDGLSVTTNRHVESADLIGDFGWGMVGFYERLRLFRHDEFEYEWGGCLGGYGRGSGDWKLEQSAVSLTWHNSEYKKEKFYPEKLLIVYWNGHYGLLNETEKNRDLSGPPFLKPFFL